MKVGRKPKYNRRLQAEICEYLAKGHTVATCCALVGIGERSYYTWCEEKLQFLQAVTRAINQSKIALVEKIRNHDDWRGAAFLLERRFPNEYGKTAERPLPNEPPPDEKKVSIAIVLDTGGKTLQEFATFPVIEGGELKALPDDETALQSADFNGADEPPDTDGNGA
jgi:hypothetical protein